MSTWLTAEEARRIFDYDPFTGCLRWKIAAAYNVSAGKIINAINGAGYVKATYQGRSYTVHQLAWLITYGKYPNGEVDHKNTDKTDNKLENLRIATHSQNNANRAAPQQNGKSGYLGVCWDKKKQKWRAHVTLYKKKYHAGYFVDINKAIAARQKRADELFGEFAPSTRGA